MIFFWEFQRLAASRLFRLHFPYNNTISLNNTSSLSYIILFNNCHVDGRIIRTLEILVTFINRALIKQRLNFSLSRLNVSSIRRTELGRSREQLFLYSQRFFSKNMIHQHKANQHKVSCKVQYFFLNPSSRSELRNYWFVASHDSALQLSL